ncbi:leptin receptor gene-related protein-like [Hydractinia symbiolongicarpus]|uniref:leptin receptor gene-related protein-like n=1 Tax=Hydractinia symbiolongicarpus TaxID=13093 RepID=UPI00254D2D17|nr:leptin receptor gene-related protein-like [Hydractinia symbiolongicarpus]XP_057298521.1 leptin receptor gene-related protein-like [Hydractinia symbiolongicarpus]XP_057298603.1 leptin receptor gene-related protein-like [Hydractinia symbiolongicarpus]
MGTLGAIVGMSFLCAIGILMVVLGCALDEFKTERGPWWIMFNLFFYILAPIPALIVRRVGSDFSSFSGTSNLVAEIALFFTAGIVVSAFGLPIVLARAGIIKYGAMGLVMTGNFFIFLTILLFFTVFQAEDEFGF